MAKVVLGKPPKSFTSMVRFAQLDGTEGLIECLFRYRTLTEYGAFIDAATNEAAPTNNDAPLSLAEIFGRTRDKNGEYLLKVLEGWNLDIALSTETAQQLCDELPGAAAAIIEAYRAAIVEGRRGN